MTSENLSLPRDVFEQVFSQPLEIEPPGQELLLCLDNPDGPCEIRTCYGDIRKIIDTLMDYARLLETVCDQWDLQAYHRAVYEFRSEELRKISKKYQTSIHYDYEATLEKCRKRQTMKQRDDDVGGEATEMAYRKAQRAAAKKLAAKSGRPPSDEKMDISVDPWDET